jgi:hypothetical protein
MTITGARTVRRACLVLAEPAGPSATGRSRWLRPGPHGARERGGRQATMFR